MYICRVNANVNRALSAGLAMAFLMAGAAISCRGASFTANPTMDAFATTGPSNNLVNSNYGGAGALGVAAAGLSQGQFQSVMQFDVSGAVSSFNSQFSAGSWGIQSVTLRLSAAPSNNPVFNTPNAGQFYVYSLVNNSWTEGSGTPASPSASGITYTSLQSLVNSSQDENLGAFSYNGATSGAATYTFTLAPGFVSEIMSGGDISLRLLATDSSVSYLFNSKNFGNSANWPVLTITPTPEPGGLWLSAAGLALLASQRVLRKRRAK